MFQHNVFMLLNLHKKSLQERVVRWSSETPASVLEDLKSRRPTGERLLSIEWLSTQITAESRAGRNTDGPLGVSETVGAQRQFGFLSLPARVCNCLGTFSAQLQQIQILQQIKKKKYPKIYSHYLLIYFKSQEKKKEIVQKIK